MLVTFGGEWVSHGWGDRKLKIWLAITFLLHRSHIFYKLYRILMVYKVQYSNFYKVYLVRIYIIEISNGQWSLNHALPYLFNQNSLLVLNSSVGESHVFMLYLIILDEGKIFFHASIINYSRGQRNKVMENSARTRMVRNRKRAASMQGIKSSCINHPSRSGARAKPLTRLRLSRPS